MKKAAVVGLGIGMAHVAGYLASPHARLVAVADAWEPRRTRVGGTFAQGSMLNLTTLFDDDTLARGWGDLGVRAGDDVRAIANDGEIDIVSLCTPDDLHEAHAVAMLDAGKDVLLEKPIALSIPSARRIIEAADRNGRRVALGFEMRVNPAVLRVRQLVADGAIGAVVAFNLQQFRTAFRRDKWQQWIQSRDRSGGLVVEETCHWFDLARFLTGKEIARVHCVTTSAVHPDFDYEDIAFVQGRFDDDTPFQIGHSLTGFDFSLTFQVYGTTGSVWCRMKAGPESRLDAGQSSHIAVVSWGPTDLRHGRSQAVTFGNEAREGESIRDNVVAFAAAVSEGSPFRATTHDGLRSLEVALAALRSAESGRMEDA